MSGKLFIGGLSWETTEESLRAVYEQFGELSDIQIICERHTGKPRGFGFVTYTDPEDAAKACQAKHVVDGRKVDTKFSVPRERFGPGVHDPATQQAATCRKIFLGGLPASSTEQSLEAYFAKFGEVQEILIMKDRNTGVARGFGFCTFVNPDSAAAALQESKTHQIDDKRVEIKPAESREACNKTGRANDGNDGWGYGGRAVIDHGYVDSASQGGFGPGAYMPAQPVFHPVPGMYPYPAYVQGFQPMPMGAMLQSNAPASWDVSYGAQGQQLGEDSAPANQAVYLPQYTTYTTAPPVEFAPPQMMSIYYNPAMVQMQQSAHVQPAPSYDNCADVGALANQFADSSLQPTHMTPTNREGVSSM
eukprot:TRINITY_DN11_c0_g1_i3.p1 TRINITY_DN11_c0_g1~~TRINITY_DN11_c0_g1_i3.p1  ORF type:complete len:362 (-),score=55.83 TRINITY_DN11_c0_g1_i3:268-1353(-)